MEELRQLPIQQGQGTLRGFLEAAYHAEADVGGGPDLQRAIVNGFFPWRDALAETGIRAEKMPARPEDPRDFRKETRKIRRNRIRTICKKVTLLKKLFALILSI